MSMSIDVTHVLSRVDRAYPPLPYNDKYSMEWADYTQFPRNGKGMKIHIFLNNHENQGMFRDLYYEASRKTRHDKDRWVITKMYVNGEVFKGKKTFSTPEQILAYLMLIT